MNKYLLALLMLSASASAEVKPARPSFNFSGINVAQAVSLIYSEAMKGDYVIDPEVLTDERLVTFRYETSKGDLQLFVSAFFDSLGLVATKRGSVSFVAKKKMEEVRKHDEEIFVYRPKFRDLSYLTRLLSPLLTGHFSVNRVVQTSQPMVTDKPVPDGSVSALLDQSSDVMVYAGSAKDVALLKMLLPQVDDRVGEVMVRAVVYEVSSGESDGSAFSLALNILSDKLTLANGFSKPLDSFIKFKNNSIDAVFSALSTDNRFKVVSTPSLRVMSGKTGMVKVGQNVPVLGAITYPVGGGPPSQSIEYQASGVIFNLAPVVRDQVVDLRVGQQVSNFAITETGVNNSPTKIVREVNTDLSMVDGEVLVMGGLTETKHTSDRKGFSFIPPFLKSKSSSSSKTEILLVLQLTKI